MCSCLQAWELSVQRTCLTRASRSRPISASDLTGDQVPATAATSAQHTAAPPENGLEICVGKCQL